MNKAQYRVKFVYDEDAEFEECNGENRPLTEAEYIENQYQACPRHPRAASKVIRKAYTRKTPNGAKHVRAIVGCTVCGETTYENVPYVEYLAYYGNPARHVYLGCIVERQTSCTCGEHVAWETAGSLWWIDFMDDDQAYLSLDINTWYTPAEAAKLAGYAGTVALGVLGEAR